MAWASRLVLRRRRSARVRRISGPSSSALSSTPTRRAGRAAHRLTCSRQRSSPRARPCCGGAPISDRPAASAALGGGACRRTRHRPRWCAHSASTVHLVDAPFAQPLGRRGFREVWRRQTRWSATCAARLVPASLHSGNPVRRIAAFARAGGRRPISCGPGRCSRASAPSWRSGTAAEVALAWAGWLAPRRSPRSSRRCAICCCPASGSTRSSAPTSSGAATP